MSGKRFRVRFEQEDGRGEIVNENGVELTAREVVDCLNALAEENEQLRQKLKSVTMLKDDYEELIESFEKKYGKNIEDVIDV